PGPPLGQYDFAMARQAGASHIPRMGKRILAAILWFYAGWYLGAILADAFGLLPILGPWLGAVAAALFAGDPRGVLWKRAAPATESADGSDDLADRLPAEPGLGEVLATH